MSGIPKLPGIMLTDGAGMGPRASSCQASVTFTCSPSRNDQNSGPFLVHSWKKKLVISGRILEELVMLLNLLVLI